ncbi:MAG: MBL fold metallo-hydrolase [Woeseiaceae bacterium]|nr:MBL fold metallo-hydrolase [Woeseiaceae bacterium]
MNLRRLALLLLFALPAASHADGDHDWGARYIANAGVMVERGDTKILFDPFFRDGFGLYDLVPEDIEAALFDGVSPWDGIDAIFISHYHGDHFHPGVVTDYLRRWPSVHAYAPQQAVDALIAADDGASDELLGRIHAIDLERDSDALEFELGGLFIEAVRIAHAGWPRRHSDTENIVYRVTLDDSATVMHLGDADSGREHYEVHDDYWQKRTSDLALVPVWLMLSEKGKHVVDEHVDAEHEIGMHVYKSIPDDPAEREPKFDGLDIFTEPGETRRWEE